MTVLRGDCVEVMNGMEPDSVDAIVTDPPYGLEFMGKEWDRLGECGCSCHRDGRECIDCQWHGRRTPSGGSKFGAVVLADGHERRPAPSYTGSPNPSCRNCGGSQRGNDRKSFKRCRCEAPDFPNVGAMQGRRMSEWHQQWATAALRVAKPGAYLLAFGGTRTVHRMTCALEDAGWVIRDMLVWAYAQGFPKSRASLKPAWEPIVLCRKPGASRDLNIDAARLPLASDEQPAGRTGEATAQTRYTDEGGTDMAALPGRRIRMQRQNSPAGMSRYGDSGFKADHEQPTYNSEGRWPANVILTDPIFDGGWEGVVGGGWQSGGGNPARRGEEAMSRAYGGYAGGDTGLTPVDTAGSYSRFFLIPKAPTRERVLSDGRRSPHPTQKPEALIRHLVTLVTPPGGLVLDPFLGSGTLGVVCDGLGVRWLGIEREAEYAQWAEDRIADRRPEWSAA